jgi:thiamine-phosphate pyrophosphorylase
MTSRWDFRLHALIGEGCGMEQSLVDLAEETIRGGATVIQLREKKTTAAQLYNHALRLREVTSRWGVCFMVNDRVDVALASGADGVHVGQDDIPIEAARRLLGYDRVVGISAHSYEEAMAADKAGADYVSVGSVYPTRSKASAVVIGLELLRELRSVVHRPMIAIGGINRENVAEVIQAGADGVAVIEALFGGSDVQRRAEELRRSLDKALKARGG